MCRKRDHASDGGSRCARIDGRRGRHPGHFRHRNVAMREGSHQLGNNANKINKRIPRIVARRISPGRELVLHGRVRKIGSSMGWQEIQRQHLSKATRSR